MRETIRETSFLPLEAKTMITLTKAIEFVTQHDCSSRVDAADGLSTGNGFLAIFDCNGDSCGYVSISNENTVSIRAVRAILGY